MPDLFDSSYKFVGPTPYARPVAEPFPFDQLGDKPLIYISLGTVNNRAREFYQATFDAFRDGPYQVVLTVGKQTEIASLGSIPSNFIVRNFVPQSEIVPRAVLFINHSGMNSVHDSLLEGVPMVLVPQQMEQALVAQQVKRLGAGVVISKQQATAARLRDAAATVLNNPSYRENAKRAGDTLRQAGGAARAADEIFAFTHRPASERVQL
jgi:MGT family glycosyltransferase